MMNDLELSQWLRLSFSYGVGPATFLKLINRFGSVSNILLQNIDNLLEVVNKGVANSILSNQVQEQVQASLDWRAASPNREIITLGHELYPVELAEIAQPPIILFCEGNLSLIKQNKIAIVGSRHPSAQGAENAKNFAYELAQNGLTVVSGMAAGIDRCAHEGALSAANGASTIAVIGTGMDLVYPASNRDIYRQIREHGLIISEFPLGTPPTNNNFPRRNRIVVGLSKACLVVESSLDGGSMISANFALEMGRDVMAIPGSIHNPMARGCHKLIKQGAKLCETATDILEELKLSYNKLNHIEKTSPNEDAVLVALGYEAQTIDVLCAKLNIDFGELCGKLLEFELSGEVINCGGGRYQRVFK